MYLQKTAKPQNYTFTILVKVWIVSLEVAVVPEFSTLNNIGGLAVLNREQSFSREGWRRKGTRGPGPRHLIGLPDHTESCPHKS